MVRAAASSIASGIPSSRRHISSTAVRLAAASNVGRHRCRPLIEQLGGRSGRVKGRHGDDPFIVQAEALPRRRQEPEVLAPLDDRLSEFGGAINDVFAVVQDEERSTGLERLRR